MAEPTLFDEASLALIASGGAGKDGKVYSIKPVPVYGPELVTNGDFATDSDWSVYGSNIAISGGKANFTNAVTNTEFLQQAITAPTGVQYRIQFEVSNLAAGDSIKVRFPFQDTTINSNGLHTLYGDGATADFLRITPNSSTGTFSIDNVSVKKVLSGDGDFTFSRGSNLAATRVGADGLIEKGRENLWLQSTALGTSPNATTSAASITGGQSGYDGSTDAWELESLSDGFYRRLYQSTTQTGVITFSIYAKASATNFLLLYNTQNGDRAWFDLSSGSLGTLNGAIDSSIEDIGSGWYRCSISLNTTISSTIWICPANANNIASCDLGNSILLQDAQLEIGLAATDYIESGATTGKAGLLEDEPRFDYSGGATCPSLLLEPSRTNLVTYSEYFEGSGWTKGRASVISNAAVSPDGLENASYFYDTTDDGTHRLYSNYFSVTSGQSQSITLYAKAGTFNKFNISVKQSNESDLAFGEFNFDLIAGTCSNSDGSIESMGNGWYKCTAVGDVNASVSARMWIYLINNSDAMSYVGTGNDYIQIYGAQCESNASYPTSYIPNHSGGSVTRGADSCTGAGDSSTFNSTEGVLYAEISALEDLGTARRYISLSDGSSNNDLRLYFNNSVGTIVALSKVGGVTQFSMFGGGYDLTEAHKIAVKYKVNDFALWIDGVEVDTDSSGLVNAPNTFNELAFNGNSLPFFGKAKQVLVFKEALSDTELIKLTTI